MKKINLFLSLLLFAQIASAEPLIDLSGLADGGAFSSKILQVIAIVTILSIAPSIVVMVTSFTRIVVVLSFVRSAMGLQQTPPNQVLISLALFLTMFIMMPTMEVSYNNGIKPLLEEKIKEEEAIPLIIQPFKKFMVYNTRSKDIDLFTEIAKVKDYKKLEDLPIQVVIPAFLISELRKAFEIGFLVFLPFLIIDIVVSSVLMAMGMMMMPPVMVSLPFKIIFFVLIDGWYMLAGSLVKSFAT